MEKGIADDINAIRANPAAFANYVNTNYLSKGIEGEPNRNDPSCYRECYNVMKVQAKLPAFAFDTGASNIARAHSVEMLNNNHFSHYGLNGSAPWDRQKKSCNENIAVTYKMNAGDEPNRKWNVMWICDCGIPSRGHRTNILTTRYNAIGVGVAAGNNGGWFKTYATMNCLNQNRVLADDEDANWN
eukprot:TRINITY_DN24086_c0_g1_i1.p2 TRINITY_DN24086_c0_g1~~TRINITY_DN24086_c0_g1_i1.p2  ORF type:complete len:206 (+),score=37.21 TRINITY_DN24086_c0_g1_i1:61-618(+)